MKMKICGLTKKILLVTITAVTIVVFVSSSIVAETIELTYWDWSLKTRLELEQRIFRDFEAENPNIKIELQMIANWWEKYPTAIAAGTTPDFWNLHENIQYEITKNYALAPFPEDIFPYSWLEENFSEYEENFQYEGKYYVMPWSLAGTMLYYNKIDFKKAGLGEADVPKSWDELVTVAEKLTIYDSAGGVERAGFLINGWTADYYLGDIFFQACGDWIKDGKSNFLSPGARKAAQWWQDLMYRYKVTDKGFPEMTSAFASEIGSMMAMATWFVGYLDADYLYIDYGVAAPPTPTGKPKPYYGNVAWETGLSVLADTSPEKKQAAWKVIKFILDNDAYLEEAARIMGGAPLKKSVREIAEHPLTKVMIAMSPYLKMIDLEVYPPGWRGHIASLRGNLTQGVDVDEALEKMDERYNEFLQRVEE